MAVEDLPLPSADLAARVGTVEGTDAVDFYVSEGARLRAVIERLLPGEWAWEGKRVLDFGCGSARVLRQFAHEANKAQFVGCDIDAPSIQWARSALDPPFKFVHNALAPPLPLDGASFDLIWAMSVFTHISDGWSDWLVELHRLMAPDGVLLASFLGPGMWEALVGGRYVEDEVGMAVLRRWQGPYAWVFHAEWWLREHWGRAFDVLHIEPPPTDSQGASQVTHSYIVLRKRDVPISREALERLDPGEGRELPALQTSLRLARADIDYLMSRCSDETHSAPRGLRYLRHLKQLLRSRHPQD